MLYQSDFYSVDYSDNDKDYISELTDTINANLKRIMNFFQILEFKHKKAIYIWHDLVAYKKHVESYVNEYQEWMVADTFDHNINLLSFDLYLSGVHRNSTLSDYCKIIIHEFVHACQQEINPDAKNVNWFWEALATNLANQNMQIVSVGYTKEDLMYNYRKLSDAYSVSYTIGKYMLTNMPHSRIMEYVKYPGILIKDIDIILEETKVFAQSRLELS